VDVHLSAQQLATLDEVSRIELGFPHDFVSSVDQVLYGDLKTRIDLPITRG
jgi:hypothetical protein